MRSILCIQSCTFDPLMYLSPCGAGVVDTGPRPCSPVPETSWSERGALPLVSACSVVWRRARRTATEQVHMQTSCLALTSRKLQLKRLQKRQLNVPNVRLRSSCITFIKDVHSKACAVMRSKFCQQKILNPQNCLDKSRSTNCDQKPLECNFFYYFSNNYICRLFI